MDNLSIYLLVLFGGMVLGGWLISSLFPLPHRYMHHHPELYSPYYPPYRAMYPRMGTQVLLFGLAFILAFSLMVGWQRQAHQSPDADPIQLEKPIQAPTAVS